METIMIIVIVIVSLLFVMGIILYFIFKNDNNKDNTKANLIDKNLTNKKSMNINSMDVKNSNVNYNKVIKLNDSFNSQNTNLNSSMINNMSYSSTNKLSFKEEEQILNDTDTLNSQYITMDNGNEYSKNTDNDDGNNYQEISLDTMNNALQKSQNNMNVDKLLALSF